MMAASLGFTDASPRPSDGSQTSQTPNNVIDDEFGSFTAAERLSDPFGDVYGAEADFGDFEGTSEGQKESFAPSVAIKSSSMMSSSPLMAPGATISSENDPFADISGTGEEEEKIMERIGASEGHFMAGKVATVSTSTSSATSAILDLVWGHTNQETDVNSLSLSETSVDSGRSRSTSNSSGFGLSLPTLTEYATFSSMAVKTPDNSTDLLSFSPVQASAPIDPFFGIDHDTSGTRTAGIPVFDKNELLTVTATPPLSTTSLSAPTSLRGSLVSLPDENVKTVEVSRCTPGSVETKLSPRSPLAERTTRSFRSLSSSFVSAGMMQDKAGQNGGHASFSTFSRDTLEATSPSSAPPSLCSSFKMTDGFPGFAHVADESDEADPFAEAGLAAPVEVPLAEALAAWSAGAAKYVTDEDGNNDSVGKCTDEEDAEDKYELAADASDDSVGTASVVEGKNDVLNTSDLTTPVETEDSQGDWTIAIERNEASDDSFTTEHQAGDVTVLHSPAAGEESDVEEDENAADLISNDNDNEVHVFGLQGDASDREVNGDVDEGDAAMTATASPVEQSSVDADDDSLYRSQIDTLSFTTATTDSNVGSASQARSTGDLEDEFSSLHEDEFNTLPISPPSVATDLRDTLDESEEKAVVETNKTEGPMQETEANDGDNFGDFGGFETASATTVTAITMSDASPWGSFPSPTTVQKMTIDDVGAIGDFAVSATTSTFADTAPADDGFGDFAQSTEPGGDDDFDDFGDFEQSSANDGDSFTDFQQSCAEAFGENDNGFGDFTPAVASTLAAPAVLVSSLSKSELSVFFKEAFPMKPLPAISPDQSESPTEVEDTDSSQKKSTEFVQDVFRNMWAEYIFIIATTGSQLSSSPGALSTTAEPKDSDAHVLLDRNTKRASKYLKYVLSEKIQEASKQNGIFTHGSKKHQMYVEFAASGDADRMCAALKELQDALFHNSVHDAMMRIAKQAALSAKAKIAEQAAQQQANSRGGSLFSTTRHLLSRSGNSGGAHGSNGTESKSDHVGADTPTGVSVQKLARYTFANNHDSSANAHRGANNGEERVSDGSDHTGHSSGSDSEAASSADSRTRSQTSNSGSSNGGLMKKFQSRFSFGSSKHRPRFVSLRRKGQSGEEVRKMELNLDAISGGLDEVKWKCALFLYDVEEVTHVAPSQISILAYPSKQPLTGKTNRSALTKLVKPDTIWTVDIGANNSDMLNEW